MPAFVMRDGGKYRIFHGSGVGTARLLLKNGEPVDGGGFESRIDAGKLAKRLNEGTKEGEVSDEASGPDDS